MHVYIAFGSLHHLLGCNENRDTCVIYSFLYFQTNASILLFLSFLNQQKRLYVQWGPLAVTGDTSTKVTMVCKALVWEVVPHYPAQFSFHCRQLSHHLPCSPPIVYLPIGLSYYSNLPLEPLHSTAIYECEINYVYIFQPPVWNNMFQILSNRLCNADETKAVLVRALTKTLAGPGFIYWRLSPTALGIPSTLSMSL